jgi:amidase
MLSACSQLQTPYTLSLLLLLACPPAQAAVAAKQADIGLGSDTGGSVRVPASFCGLYGIRPTHGRITLEGGRPLAPSFDTVGWFTRDAELLQLVGEVLYGSSCSQLAAPGRPPAAGTSGAAAAAGGGSGAAQDLSRPRWLVGKDAFGLASPEAGQAVYGALSGDRFAAVTAVLGQPTEVEVAGAPSLAEHGLTSLQRWFTTFRVCQVRS